ncbi:MAG: radical SAM protein [Candidatus Omnitrophota bacterium]
MKDQKEKYLLIWPPFLTAYNLPLGIPFLSAYLKKNGISGVDVLDLNISYLKKFRLLYFIHSLNKNYHGLAGTIIKRPSNDKKNKPRPLWRKALSMISKFINRNMSALLDLLKDKEKNSVPWSLDSMINSDIEKNFPGQTDKLYHILKPIIEKKKLGLVGISVIYPEQLHFSLLTAKIIKERFGKDIPVALGGAQITKHISHLIKSPKVAKLVDFLVAGDGEEPLLHLIKKLPENNFLGVPNLYYRARGEETLFRSSKNTFHLHPDNFPIPDFTGFDIKTYIGQLPLLASKGCFWSKCSFCTYACIHENKFIISSAQKTFDTIKQMKISYGASSFKFVDDALPPRFMKNLAELLVKEGLNIKWACSIVLSTDFADANFCDMLKRSGLQQVSIGLESISQRILKLMNKFHKDLAEGDIKNVLSGLKNAGIKTGLHIIFGFPTETRSEARQTLAFLTQHKDLYDMCMFQPFCLEDATPVFSNPERFGIKKIHREDKDSGERLGYRYEVTEGMDQKEALEFTYGEALEAFRIAKVPVRSSAIKSR